MNELIEETTSNLDESIGNFSIDKVRDVETYQLLMAAQSALLLLKVLATKELE